MSDPLLYDLAAGDTREAGIAAVEVDASVLRSLGFGVRPAPRDPARLTAAGADLDGELAAFVMGEVERGLRRRAAELGVDVDTWERDPVAVVFRTHPGGDNARVIRFRTASGGAEVDTALDTTPRLVGHIVDGGQTWGAQAVLPELSSIVGIANEPVAAELGIKVGDPIRHGDPVGAWLMGIERYAERIRRKISRNIGREVGPGEVDWSVSVGPAVAPEAD